MRSVSFPRRTVRASVFATVLSLASPLVLISVVGCGDTPQAGGTVKEDARPQQGIDAMKDFMKKGGGGTAKK